MSSSRGNDGETLATRRARLAAGMAGVVEGDDYEPEQDEEEDDFWANINIKKMTRKELKIALEARGLSIKGKQAGAEKQIRAKRARGERGGARILSYGGSSAAR